jgi:hypothetical protein
VETNPSDGSVVFVEFLEQCAHPIVPKLDGAIVQADYKKKILITLTIAKYLIVVNTKVTFGNAMIYVARG